MRISDIMFGRLLGLGALGIYNRPSGTQPADLEFGPRRHWQASDFHYRWKTRDFVTRYTPHKRPLIFEYSDVVAQTRNDIPDEPRFLPQILPGWDDTPRYGQNGVVYDNATPELFAGHLAKAIAIVENRPQEEAIIFIKAWNEWAEGNYLEPDTRYRHAYLHAKHWVSTRLSRGIWSMSIKMKPAQYLSSFADLAWNFILSVWQELAVPVIPNSLG